MLVIVVNSILQDSPSLVSSISLMAFVMSISITIGTAPFLSKLELGLTILADMTAVMGTILQFLVLTEVSEYVVTKAAVATSFSALLVLILFALFCFLSLSDESVVMKASIVLIALKRAAQTPEYREQRPMVAFFQAVAKPVWRWLRHPKMSLMWDELEKAFPDEVRELEATGDDDDDSMELPEEMTKSAAFIESGGMEVYQAKLEAARAKKRLKVVKSKDVTIELDDEDVKELEKLLARAMVGLLAVTMVVPLVMSELISLGETLQYGALVSISYLVVGTYVVTWLWRRKRRERRRQLRRMLGLDSSSSEEEDSSAEGEHEEDAECETDLSDVTVDTSASGDGSECENSIGPATLSLNSPDSNGSRRRSVVLVGSKEINPATMTSEEWVISGRAPRTAHESYLKSLLAPSTSANPTVNSEGGGTVTADVHDLALLRPDSVAGVSTLTTTQPGDSEESARPHKPPTVIVMRRPSPKNRRKKTKKEARRSADRSSVAGGGDRGVGVNDGDDSDDDTESVKMNIVRTSGIRRHRQATHAVVELEGSQRGRLSLTKFLEGVDSAAVAEDSSTPVPARGSVLSLSSMSIGHLSPSSLREHPHSGSDGDSEEDFDDDDTTAGITDSEYDDDTDLSTTSSSELSDLYVGNVNVPNAPPIFSTESDYTEGDTDYEKELFGDGSFLPGTPRES
eukprot:GFYU01015307.1.p1 GENE.GFYU01015307.1~~GFYU01015307.1.p1  ORF type:complete len:783 (-),score=183.34 GFYU01015307.1:136-2190(-)